MISIDIKHAPPNKLYRFVTLSTFEKMLTNGSIIMSKPFTFNDPFDCKAVIAHEHPQFEKNVQEIIDSRARLTCFSANRPQDNLLMWSHYAEHHEGLCLEFDVRNWISHEMSTDEYGLRIVKYKTKRPIITINPKAFENLSMIDNLIFTKHKKWEYENEWRIVFVHNDKNKWKDKHLLFPKSALSRIYLGIRMSIDNKNKVQRLILDNNYSKSRVLEASENKTKFGLIFRRFNSQ